MDGKASLRGAWLSHVNHLNFGGHNHIPTPFQLPRGILNLDSSNRLATIHGTSTLVQTNRTGQRSDSIGRTVFSERERSLFAVTRPSVVCLSVCLSVTLVCPSQAVEIFRQYFYSIRYLGHLLTSTKNVTEIVPGEPLRRGR